MPVRFKRAALRLQGERGFTMLAVLGAMLAIMGLSVAAFAAANGDQHGARRDQDHKRAYSAAEAGVAEYVFRLGQDSSYWTRCTNVPAPAKVNQRWNGGGADPRARRTIPASDATYAIELIPVAPAPACDPANPLATMINPSTGTFRVRSTGFARATKRSLNVTLRRRGFLDYLYFTDLETMNPVAYRVATGGIPTTPVEDVQQWATRECGYWRDGRGTKRYTGIGADGSSRRAFDFGCTEISFITGDLIRGPLHTNDQLRICGSPTFGRGPQDAIEVVQDPGWRNCGSGSPTFDGRYEPGAAYLGLPPSNTALKETANAGYVFSGRTRLKFSGSTVTVTDQDGAVSTKPLPPNGVIYVDNDVKATCAFYDATNTEPSPSTKGCGDAYVSGTYNSDITIGSRKDIVVDGDFRRSGDAVAGLIANDFVRVDHQVAALQRSWNGTSYSWDCDNKVGATIVRQIDAAVLALNHSFIVDNWFCGAPLGTLTVTGAIAQKYRGPVGTFSGNSPISGYSKNYIYDDRLRYRQPPHFLDPVQSSWRVVRQTEQLPAR